VAGGFGSQGSSAIGDSFIAPAVAATSKST